MNGVSGGIVVVPTDELTFISEEADDKAMSRRMVAALLDEDTRPRGTLGHMLRENVKYKELKEAVEFAETRSPKSMRSRGLVGS